MRTSILTKENLMMGTSGITKPEKKVKLFAVYISPKCTHYVYEIISVYMQGEKVSVMGKLAASVRGLMNEVCGGGEGG